SLGGGHIDDRDPLGQVGWERAPGCQEGGHGVTTGGSYQRGPITVRPAGRVEVITVAGGYVEHLRVAHRPGHESHALGGNPEPLGEHVAVTSTDHDERVHA